MAKAAASLNPVGVAVLYRDYSSGLAPPAFIDSDLSCELLVLMPEGG